MIYTTSIIAMGVLGFMALGFVFALWCKRNDLADVWWGLGFVGIGVSSLFLTSHIHWTQIVITALVTVWGLRLAFYIGRRFLSHTTEDARYATWREEWSKKGAWYTGIRSLFQVFILQGMLMFGVMLPVMIFNFSKIQILTPFFIIGILVWSIGFFFEVVGDWQLKNFLQSRSGGIMNKGLWRYTRHPNYFGEVTMWWGLWIAVLGATLAWVGFFGPLLITMLILYVSGIPMTEARYKGNKAYKEYQSTTSALIPLKPFQ